MHQKCILDGMTSRGYWSVRKKTNLHSHLEMVQKNVSKKLQIPRTHSKAGSDRKEWFLRGKKFKANRKNLNRQNLKMTLALIVTELQSHDAEVMAENARMCIRLVHSSLCTDVE